MLHVGHEPGDCTTNRAIACKLDISQHIKHPTVGLILDVTAKTVNTTAWWPIMLQSNAPNTAKTKNDIKALWFDHCLWHPFSEHRYSCQMVKAPFNQAKA